MAGKGQKFNKYTDEFKKDIALQHINEGKSYGYLSKTYGISAGTIATWIKTFNLGNENMSYNRGRPKKDEDVDYKEKICKEPSFTLTRVSNTHLTNTKLSANPTEY